MFDYILNIDMDPAQNTVEDLMLRICHQEAIGNSKAVCLYTIEGMPLTDDPFFNTCTYAMPLTDDPFFNTCTYARYSMLL